MLSPAVLSLPVDQTWSCWMVADPNQGTLISVGANKIADALRHWLGDAMSTELVPAKCAARLGQAFSTTVDATTMSEHEVVGFVCALQH